METANEGEGDNFARSTTASEQIADGPPARDSENNDSTFKEDTLQQMLTCETGNTGTKASTPPCDKGTTGQGLHGTSPGKDNLDKGQDAISLIQLEAPEVAEADALEGPMDLDVTSSDESGDWETASEASVVNEESSNVKGEKQDESLDGNEKVDICGQKETGDCLELQTPSGHLENTGHDGTGNDGNGTGELAEEKICKRTYSKGLQGEQAFTHGEESLCDDGKTERQEMPPHADEALRKSTVSEEPDPNVEGTVTEESGSYFVNTEFHIEKLTDEASGTGGSVTHDGKSDLQNEEAVNEWTRPHEEKGSHNEEGAIKGIKAPFEETADRNMDLQTNISASGMDEAQLRESVCEAREPHVPHAEETIQKFRESLVMVTESESIDPDGNKLVRIETEPYAVKILIEQCSPPMEEAVNFGTGLHEEGMVTDHTTSHAGEAISDGTGHQRDGEMVSDHAKPQAEGAVSDGTGHHYDEETVSDHVKPQAEEAVSDGTGHHYDEEMVSDHAKPQAEGAVSDGTGHHCDEEMVSDHAKSHVDGAVSDGTGHHHDEEIVRDHAKSQPKELYTEESICSAETNECYVKETLSEESGPDSNETDHERTVTYDEAWVSDERGPRIGEILAERNEVDANIEETKSDQTLSAELEENNITQVTEESNDSGYVIGKEQGPLDTSTSKEAADRKTEKVNNEEVVDSLTINKGFNVDQKETAEDETENDITKRVSEETASKVTAQDIKEGISQLLDVDIEHTVTKETEGASTETVFQVLSGAIEETVGLEAGCVYIETANEHAEEGHKETLTQVTLDPTRGTVIDDTLGEYVKSDCKETDDGSIEVFKEEALYKEPVSEHVHTDSRDTPMYETAADAMQFESLTAINALQTIESVDETLTVDHKEMPGRVKETSDSDSIERQNEKITHSFVETTEQGSDAQNMDNTFVERIKMSSEELENRESSEELELTKRRAKQESEELVSLKERCGEISEVLPDIPNLNYESEPGEDEISWYAEETGLQAIKEDMETSWLEGESLDTHLDEVEANLMFPERLLKEEDLKRLLDIDVDQAVSINDGISYMDVAPDKGTKIDTAEQLPLDETMIKEIEGGDSDKYPSLNDMEISSAFGMVIEPLPMRPLVFSSDRFQNLNVVEPNLQTFQMGDVVESLGDSHQKDFTDFEYREQGSSLGETLSNRLQAETIQDEKQIQGVIKVARIVGIPFSQGNKELAEDQPDCFNQGSIFDKRLLNSTFLPQAKPFTKSETDEVFGQEATLTVATEPDLSDITLSHGGPVVDDQGKLDSSIKTVEHSDGTRVDSLPILITRQRSNTDPCLIYDQEEKDNTQQDDQQEKGKPRPRLRSVTPPLDNFTVSFTASTPQAIPESKPLEKAQDSVMYPDVDFNISEEQKTEEATPRQSFTFFPTQIFNPLFFIKEGREEHGFYQGKPLLPPVEENINKRRIPSPPRDTSVPMKVQQPQSIGRPSRPPASARTTMETSATDPSATQPVTPLWLPPRPLRHAESAVGKDFRPLIPTENRLVRRSTVRVKKSTVGGPALKRISAMNLPTIPQEVPSGEKSSMEKSSRPAGTKSNVSNTTRPLPRQLKVNEQDVAQPKNKSPMERLAEAEEISRKSPRSPEAVLRRTGKHSQIQPSTSDTTQNIHRRYSNFIHSYSLLYQEYSDVALNQEIQRQKPGDSPVEEKDPGSPRQRRRILSSQDSYLQRLSISSADSLWQDLPKVRDSVTFMAMSREEQKLQEAKFELIMSEALYLRSLNIAVDHFQRSTELQEVLSAQDRQWLFSRLSEVRDASNDFLFDLEEEFENNMYKFQVCDVVIAHEPNFRKVYLPYVTNQSYQDRTFQRLMNGNPRFQHVLSKLESDSVCQRLSLKSFLILPFQRITRLRLLLQNILKRSAPGSSEELQATEAHNAIEKLIRDCNEGVQKMKDTEELILLHQKIQFECKIFPLISASRRLVKHGEVTSLEFNPISFKWKGTTRQVYVHLFSDCLLLSRIREGGRFVVFDHASDFRVERCEIKLHSNQKNIFRVFLRDSAATQARDGYLEGQEMEYIFRTETQSQKLRWIYALSPPKQEIDFLRDGLTQVQCLKSYKARENDEMSLEKADILMVTQNSDDGWLCGIRLSDLQSGWFPQCHAQSISRNACLRNLQEEQRLQTARAKLHPSGAK